MDKTKQEVETNDQTASTDHTEVENKESEASADQETQIDYKAELEKANLLKQKAEEERDNYKTGLLTLKKKKKEEKVEEEDVEEEDIDSKIDKRLGSFESKFVKGAVEAYVSQMTTDPNKRELIKHHYESSIIHSGVDPESIKNDLDNALLIVDKKILLKEKSELATSLHNRQGISRIGNGTSDEKDNDPKPFFTAEQLADLKKRGFDEKKIAMLQKNLKKASGR